MKKGLRFLALSMCLTLLAGVFTSCDNFLQAEDVKKQLEDMIAYANAPSYKISVSYDPAEGELRKPVLAETYQKVTDVFEIKFEPAKDHVFYKWEASSVDLPAGEKIEDYIEFENPLLSGTRVTFKKALTNIVLKASSPSLPYTYVTINGSKGKFSPSKGTYACIDTYTYPLSFEPDADYEFICWEIYDKNNEGFTGIFENGKYIKIDDVSNQDTTYSFVEAPEDSELSLGIRPVIAERPQTLSCTPLFGVEKPKESPIQVIFDHDMDPYSIFYTEKEIEALIDSGIKEQDLLPPETTEKHYGYKKKIGSNEVYYFKNISITDENGNNLLSMFEAPVFETNRILSIVPKNQNTIPEWTQINVTLDKDFYYEEAEKHVTMPMSKKWVYMVNGTDGEAPDIDDKTSISIGNQTLSDTLSEDTTFYEKVKKINLDLIVHDTGSGPDNIFTVLLKKGSQVIDSFNPKYQRITSQSASYKGEVVLSNTGLSAGIYTIELKVKDRAGKSATQDFKFEYSIGKPPAPSALYCVEEGSNSVKIAWVPVEVDEGEEIDNYYLSYSGTYEGGTDFSDNKTLTPNQFSYIIGGGVGYPKIKSLNVTIWTKRGTEVSNTASFDVFAEPSPNLTFFMPIEDVFVITGRGTVATGKIARGTINVSDSVQIVGNDSVLSSVCTGIEMFRKMLDSASEGDNVGILLRGIDKDQLSRGMMVVKPNEMQNHSKFKAYIYVNTLAEGGYNRNVISGDRPQFYSQTTDITGGLTVIQSENQTLNAIEPGKTGIITVELIRGMPIFAGETFEVRQGGKTVGYGTILEITE